MKTLCINFYSRTILITTMIIFIFTSLLLSELATVKTLIPTLEQIYASMYKKTFDDLIPDSVVSYIIKETLYPYGAYKNPSTQDANEILFYKANKRIFCSEFGANEETCLNVYNLNEKYLKERNLTENILSPIIMNIRNLITYMAREYLMDPQKLQAIYESKKKIVLSDVLRYTTEENARKEFLAWIQKIDYAFTASQDKETQKKIIQYLVLEESIRIENLDVSSRINNVRELLDDIPNCKKDYCPEKDILSDNIYFPERVEFSFPKDLKEDDLPKWKNLKVQWDKYRELEASRNKMIDEFQAKQKEISDFTHDLQATLWLTRRRMENQQTVPVYLRIVSDFTQELKALYENYECQEEPADQCE